MLEGAKTIELAKVNGIAVTKKNTVVIYDNATFEEIDTL